MLLAEDVNTYNRIFTKNLVCKRQSGVSNKSPSWQTIIHEKLPYPTEAWLRKKDGDLRCADGIILVLVFALFQIRHETLQMPSSMSISNRTMIMTCRNTTRTRENIEHFQNFHVWKEKGGKGHTPLIKRVRLSSWDCFSSIARGLRSPMDSFWTPLWILGRRGISTQEATCTHIQLVLWINCGVLRVHSRVATILNSWPDRYFYTRSDMNTYSKSCELIAEYRGRHTCTISGDSTMMSFMR